MQRDFLATKYGLANEEPGRLVKADPECVHAAFVESLRLGIEYVEGGGTQRQDDLMLSPWKGSRHRPLGKPIVAEQQ
jgi:hypothetical protein